MKHFFLSALLAITFSLGLHSENKTAVFTVSPQMSCQNCENKIKSNLRFEKGVKDIKTSLEAQTVTVTYDDKKTDPAKIAAGFKKIGYTATEGAPASCTGDHKSCCKDKTKCSGDHKSCCKSKSKCSGDHKSCCKSKSK